MNGPGLLWMLQTAVGLSMAGPMVVIGVELVRGGQRLLGVGFLVLGALVLFFPSYLVRRIGGPRTWIRRRFERRADESATGGSLDDDSEQGPTDTETDRKGHETDRRGSGGIGLRDRFRRR